MSAHADVLVASSTYSALQHYVDSATALDAMTFNPDGFVAPGVARWVDRSGDYAVGWPSITMSIRKPSKASRMYKVMLKVVLPTLAVTSPSTGSGIQPAPEKAYEHQALLEVFLPERGSLDERKQLFSMLSGLFASQLIATDNDPYDDTDSPLRAAIENLEPVSGV